MAFCLVFFFPSFPCEWHGIGEPCEWECNFFLFFVASTRRPLLLPLWKNIQHPMWQQPLNLHPLIHPTLNYPNHRHCKAPLHPTNLRRKWWCHKRNLFGSRDNLDPRASVRKRHGLRQVQRDRQVQTRPRITPQYYRQLQVTPLFTHYMHSTRPVLSCA
jgi:hypothetical protein